MTTWWKRHFSLSYHCVKFNAYKSCGSGDFRFFVLPCDITWSYDQRGMRLGKRELFKLSHHCPKFDACRSCRSEIISWPHNQKGLWLGKWELLYLSHHYEEHFWLVVSLSCNCWVIVDGCSEVPLDYGKLLL